MPSMESVEVYSVLKQIGATKIYHANTVLTSCTLLELGGLASRALVEAQGLPQTPQYSDGKDKEYKIWDGILVDHVDIHNRARKRNQYGPVLFLLDLEWLLGLPDSTCVRVTKGKSRSLPARRRNDGSMVSNQE
jgi:hypothetical protein